MALLERERIDDRVSIGIPRLHNGTPNRYCVALFRSEEGKQKQETLRTSNKSQARKLAIQLSERLANGDEKPIESTITVEQLVPIP